MSHPQTTAFLESQKEAQEELQEIFRENETFDTFFSGNFRSKFKNCSLLKTYTVEDMNERALDLDLISLPDYQRTRVALEKLPF